MAKATKKTAQEPLPFPARTQRQMETRTRSPNPHTVGVSTDDNANPSAWGTQSETSREAKKGARSPPRNPPSLPSSVRAPSSPDGLRRVVVRKEDVHKPNLFGVDQPRLRHLRSSVGVLALPRELLALERQRSLLR